MKQKRGRYLKSNSRSFLNRINMWLYRKRMGSNSSFAKIPPNISSKIQFRGNSYATFKSIQTVLHIEKVYDLPICFLEDINRFLRHYDIDAQVDMVMKTVKYTPDYNNTSFDGKERIWRSAVTNPQFSDLSRDRYMALIHTREDLKQGVAMSKAYVALVVRATTGEHMDDALKKVQDYLVGRKCSYRVLSESDIVQSTTPLSQTKFTKQSKQSPVIVSTTTMSQYFPNNYRAGDDDGLLLGFCQNTSLPYYYDIFSTKMAKHILCIAPSGAGKSYMFLNFLSDALDNVQHPNVAAIVHDVKGNEFTAIARGLNGLLVDLSETSSTYLNTIRLYKDSPDSKHYEEQVIATARCLTYLAGYTEEDREYKVCEGLFTRFLDVFYIERNIERTNKYTWVFTEHLTYWDFLEALPKYFTQQIDDQSGGVAYKVLTALRPYMRNQPKSYALSKEFNLQDIDNRLIVFQYNLLTTTSKAGPLVTTKQYMAEIISQKAHIQNYRKGYQTIDIEEELQIAPKFKLHEVRRSITTDRSLNVTKVIIANSINFIFNDETLKVILDSITFYLVGTKIKPEEEALVITKLGLDKYTELFDQLKDEENQYSFLTRNTATKWDETPTLIKVPMTDIVKSRLFVPE